MSNYKVNEQDKNRAEKIRSRYVSRTDNKMEQLQKLDNKVKLPGKLLACILGVIGALVMGAGMSMVMVWENMTLGLIFGISGLIMMILAYPIYSIITNSRKKKYADDIIRLTDDLINE